MNHWTLDCLTCGKNFPYAEAKLPAIQFEVAEKPPFPPEGKCVQCPVCGESRTYQTYMFKFARE